MRIHSSCNDAHWRRTRLPRKLASRMLTLLHTAVYLLFKSPPPLFLFNGPWCLAASILGNYMTSNPCFQIKKWAVHSWSKQIFALHTGGGRRAVYVKNEQGNPLLKMCPGRRSFGGFNPAVCTHSTQTSARVHV
jgi:hypothetical protein